MSELKIVTPEECTIPDDTKRELVCNINQTLLSGKRVYNAARAHVGFVRKLAEASGWSVSHRQDDRGNVVQLLFTTSEDRVAPESASVCCIPSAMSLYPYNFIGLDQQWIGASPR